MPSGEPRIQCTYDALLQPVAQSFPTTHAMDLICSTELSPHEDTVLSSGDLILLVSGEEDCVVRVQIGAADKVPRQQRTSLPKQHSPARTQPTSAKKHKKDNINSVLMAHARLGRAFLYTGCHD